MELVGEEKRIRALFCELKLDDEDITPRFTTVWVGVQSRTLRPRSALNFSFVTATMLLVFTFFFLALLSRHWQRSQQPNAVATVPSITSVSPAPAVVNLETNQVAPVKQNRRSNANPRTVKVAARRQGKMPAAEQAEFRNAAAISSWQSPTIAFLRSPGDEVLTSLPQLEETADALRSFLVGRSN